jgi:type I restriction enzyme R subunit
MSNAMTESVVEQAVLRWLGDLGYAVAAGPDIAPEGANPERASFADVILVGRLRAALVKINPAIPADAIDEAVRKVTHADTPSLIENNRRLHRLMTEGVDVEYSRPDGSVAGDKVWLIDFTHPEDNDFLAVNQFTVVEDRHTRRLDVVVFVNGVPLAVLELKNPTDVDPEAFPESDLMPGNEVRVGGTVFRVSVADVARPAARW